MGGRLRGVETTPKDQLPQQAAPHGYQPTHPPTPTPPSILNNDDNAQARSSLYMSHYFIILPPPFDLPARSHWNPCSICFSSLDRLPALLPLSLWSIHPLHNIKASGDCYNLVSALSLYLSGFNLLSSSSPFVKKGRAWEGGRDEILASMALVIILALFFPRILSLCVRERVSLLDTCPTA